MTEPKKIKLRMIEQLPKPKIRVIKPKCNNNDNDRDRDTSINNDPKYILSIDVAIKHLSFCILEKSKIIDWKLIDLLQTDLNNNICDGIKKDGAKCTNKAKWQFQNNDACINYCEIHKGDVAGMKKISKKLLCNCGAMAKYIDDKCNGFCERHNKNNNCRWYTVDNINDLELRLLLFKKLDSFDFSMISTVIIERQPKLATEKMRSLAYAIFDYFIIKIGHYANFAIEWIDPKNKLYIYDGPIIECPIKNQYDRNKWFACKYCEWNLTKYGEVDYINFYNNTKKQDDLADCYLQGLFYQTRNIAKKMSAQQRSVFTEQNLRKYTQVRPKKPKNIKAKIILSGIKYYVKRREITQPVLDSIAFYFGAIAIEKLY